MEILKCENFTVQKATDVIIARYEKLTGNKGEKQDPDAIRRGANKRMGANAYNARKVEQVDVSGVVLAVFGSLADAARYAGVHKQDIYNCCIGRQKSTHETRWKYAEQDDD